MKKQKNQGGPIMTTTPIKETPEQKIYDTPSVFSVSHYILLFIVSTLCTVAVVWVLIAANNREAALNDKLMKQNDDKTCQRNTADDITTMWETTPNNIPPKYKILETNYARRIVPVRTTGTCNGKKFICKMGTPRIECDPCAKNSAKKRAMFQHISDTIDNNCKDQ